MFRLLEGKIIVKEATQMNGHSLKIEWTFILKIREDFNFDD
jgi:hypothetical protein